MAIISWNGRKIQCKNTKCRLCLQAQCCNSDAKVYISSSNATLSFVDVRPPPPPPPPPRPFLPLFPTLGPGRLQLQHPCWMKEHDRRSVAQYPRLQWLPRAWNVAGRVPLRAPRYRRVGRGIRARHRYHHQRCHRRLKRVCLLLFTLLIEIPQRHHGDCRHRLYTVIFRRALLIRPTRQSMQVTGNNARQSKLLFFA